MAARAIMIQGAGSNVGKSLLVAGLARAFVRRGLSVAPFKPQNMSNNAAVTADGGEIGRAQALQARAAGRPPLSDMNPVLLKPDSETGAQLILQGRRIGRAEARAFWGERPNLMPSVLESFARLARDCDLVLVEGAGSPAETNLRQGDIANMGFACAADVPVVLVGDIDRGGVIAQIVGTQAVLSAADRAQVAGFAINKFRGDVRLFDAGLADIVRRTGWPSLGVVPWFDQAWRLPAEDMLDLASRPGDGRLVIAVPQLPRIANFDDLDPLAAEPGIDLRIVPPGRALPGDADLVLLPGSKATIADLAALRRQGWDIDLAAHLRRGGHVVGLCGGFQMLGRAIHDPQGLEGPAASVPGLGLLDVETTLAPEKTLAERHAACCLTGASVTGYEIHLGRTAGPGLSRPWFRIGDAPEGAVSRDGRVRGSYLHGVFSSDAFRAAFLGDFGLASDLRHDDSVEDALDGLAAHLERHLDLDRIREIARVPRL
ncbi:MAG: cobyric acid synthase [Rhodobacteraceae bacterium]|nr:MAG: cobyric acid synthase [Paracoccaceae bacterium]